MHFPCSIIFLFRFQSRPPVAFRGKLLNLQFGMDLNQPDKMLMFLRTEFKRHLISKLRFNNKQQF